MKKIHVCTVELAVQVEDGQAPEDGLTALLTENCHEFVPESCLLDWQYEKEFEEVEVEDDFGLDDLQTLNRGKGPRLIKLADGSCLQPKDITGMFIKPDNATLLGLSDKPPTFYLGVERDHREDGFIQFDSWAKAQAELDRLMGLANG